MGEGEGGNFREISIETCILSRVKQITSPGWMHETSAWPGALGKPRGIGWRGRLGGGIGVGNTCICKADSCQCITKTTIRL